MKKFLLLLVSGLWIVFTAKADEYGGKYQTDVVYSYSCPILDDFEYSGDTYGQYEVDGMYYCVLDEEKRTAALVANHKVKEVAAGLPIDMSTPTCFDWEPGTLEGDIVVPEKVNLDGKEYTVVMIGYGVFYGCDKLRSVTIPPTVEFVSNMVFYGCDSLEYLYFDHGFYLAPFSSIDSYSFKMKEVDFSKCTAVGFGFGCPSVEILKLPQIHPEWGNCFFYPALDIAYKGEIKEIWLFQDKPFNILLNGREPEIPDDMKPYFDNVILYVPSGSGDAYRNAVYWHNYRNIVEMAPTSVEDINTEPSVTTEYYDLNGMPVRNPEKGIFIRRTGKKTDKVLLGK